MRRHAWNCDLSTKPGTDILTNRHIYISLSLSLARSPARPTTTRPQPARSPLPRQRSAPHHPKARRNPSPQRRRSLRRDRTRHEDQNHPLHHHFPRTGWHKDLMGGSTEDTDQEGAAPIRIADFEKPTSWLVDYNKDADKEPKHTRLCPGPNTGRLLPGCFLSTVGTMGS